MSGGREEGCGGQEGGRETVVWLSAGGVEGKVRGRLVGEEGERYRAVVAGRLKEEFDRLSSLEDANGEGDGGMEGLVQCRLELLRACLQALDSS